MRFAHLSDTHLGFRQYGLYERELDFYRSFDDTVKKIIAEKPDFVIHSGDLFDYPKPPPRAIRVAQKAFARLNEKGIPVYAITGNHDMLMRKGFMPAQVLYSELGVRLFTEDEPFVVKDGIFISGIPYMPRSRSSVIKEMMNMLSEKAKKHKKSVIALHLGTDRHLPHDFEVAVEDIPRNFDYYAMGHIHNRIVEKHGNGILAYPGSSGLWSINEYDDWKRNGKGFFMVDLSGDTPDVRKIDTEKPREIIRETLDANVLKEKIDDIRRNLSQLKKKPLLFLKIKGDDFERSALHDMISSKISDLVLSLRISYESASGSEQVSSSGGFELPRIHEMIKELVKEPEKASLASSLFSSLSQGNEEQALEEAESFFRGMGEKK